MYLLPPLRVFTRFSHLLLPLRLSHPTQSLDYNAVGTLRTCCQLRPESEVWLVLLQVLLSPYKGRLQFLLNLVYRNIVRQALA